MKFKIQSNTKILDNIVIKPIFHSKNHLSQPIKSKKKIPHEIFFISLHKRNIPIKAAKKKNNYTQLKCILE